MQRIPVATARLGQVLCVVPPEPRVTPDGEQRRDRDGTPQWVVGVNVRQLEGRRSDALEITVPGEPKGIRAGMAVTLENLTATHWEIGDRSGMSWRASAIQPEEMPTVPSTPARSSGKGDAS